jgi:serine/threonine protein kinase
LFPPGLREPSSVNGIRFFGSSAGAGWGEVYSAEDRVLGTPIAIKTINGALSKEPNAIARMKREVLLARRVTHPHVCRTFDLGCDGSIFFLTMELLEGETLRAHLRRVGRLSLEIALSIAKQLAGAIDAAHRVGVIHRDLKSDNVILLPGSTPASRRAVVTDFGLAKLNVAADVLDQSPDRPSGRLVGTLGYMAPEQIAGGAVSGRTDIYALGVLLREMVTGCCLTAPRQGRSSGGAVGSRRGGASARPLTLPRIWDAALGRCLEADPSDRFASALDLVTALSDRKSLSSTFFRSRAVPGIALVGSLVALITMGEAHPNQANAPMFSPKFAGAFAAVSTVVSAPEQSHALSRADPKPSIVVSPAEASAPPGGAMTRKFPRQSRLRHSLSEIAQRAMDQLPEAENVNQPPAVAEGAARAGKGDDDLLAPRFEDHPSVDVIDPYRSQ